MLATYELTIQDVRALRNADSVTFHYNDGDSFIRAHLWGDSSPTGFDQWHHIPALGRVANYEDSGADVHLEAFYMIGSARVNGGWQTVLRRLRTGLSLSIEWVRGNDTDNYRAVDYHADECHLAIGKATGPADRFLIGYQVGPSSSARMVRRVS